MPLPALNLVQRLFALVAFALLPAILLLIVAVAELRGQREAAARDQVRRIVADTTGRLERIVEGIHQSLLVLSEANSVQTGNIDSCPRRLRNLGQRIPNQIVIAAANREGWLLCTTTGAPPLAIFGGDRPAHRLPIELGGFVVTGYDSGLILGGSSLQMGLPVRPVGGGPPVGTVTAALGVGWIAEQLRSVGLPAGAELVVLDRDDRIVVRITSGEGSTPPGPKPGDRAPDALLRLLPASPTPTAVDVSATEPAAPEPAFSAPGADGTERLYALAPFVPGTGGALRLAVSLDAGGALASVAAAERRWALLVALGLVASLLAAWLGARRFLLRPIGALQETARQWAGGDYAARAAPEMHDPVPELGRLASALDQVAAAAGERDRAAAALAEKEARLSLALEAGELGAWELDPRSGAVIRSPRHDALFGYDEPVPDWSYRTMLRHVVPDDRAMVESIFRSALAGPTRLRAQCRIRRAGDGEVRWIEATGAPHFGQDGKVKYLGVIADTTDRRRNEQHLRLVAGELNHRVKNTLAAVQSIALQTLRWSGDDAPAAGAARAAFQSRLLALARSHDLLTRERWTGADLAEVAASALAPHAGVEDWAGAPPRVRIAGPPLRLSPRSAIPLAMALHELATNAARHGALSVPRGRVAVTWTLAASEDGSEPTMALRWQESGGPPISGPPSRRGFGSRLLEHGLALELRGTVRMDFAPGGLVCDIEAPLSVVASPDQHIPMPPAMPAAPSPHPAPVGA